MLNKVPLKVVVNKYKACLFFLCSLSFTLELKE